MNLAPIFTIAGQETRISMRNRWTLLFAGVFGLLALAISYFGLVTEGYAGFQGFARTTASLLSLVLYLVPLVALTMATPMPFVRFFFLRGNVLGCSAPC